MVFSIFPSRNLPRSNETNFWLFQRSNARWKKKLIHSVGDVAQCELVSEPGNPYPGVFQGVSNALVRISTAKEADSKKDPTGNFTPGLGLKLLRDGVPSANIVAMLGVDGQDSWNPFKYDWSNHIASPKATALKLLAKKFSEATPYVGRLGLKSWASIDQTGKKTDDSNLKIPFKLIFSPNAESKNLFPDTYSDLLTNQLKTIKAGTILFDILAVAEPKSTPVKIGSLITKSNFVTSKFGDKDLFFQHNYMEDDLQLHPDGRLLLMLTLLLWLKLWKKFITKD